MPRRRYLTMLSSDLTGSTRLAGELEAEDYARLLALLRHAYETVIPQFGGTMVQISGDGLLAVFGYPTASEGDGRTATMAALELHARVRALDAAAGGHKLRLHTGIHSGLVLVDEGDPVRGRLELLGGAINIASRLANSAQSDEILVSEATLGPDRFMFQTGERLSLSLTGKDKPIAAFRILDQAPGRTRFAGRERRSLRPFVGRREELDRLVAIVDRVVAGGTSLVSIVGPPGVGKTRLVSELLARHGGGLTVCRGECDAHLGAEPLQPFLQILRALLGGAGPAAPAASDLEASLEAITPSLAEHGAVLRQLLVPAGPGGRRRRPEASAVAAALRELIGQLAADAPLALFIDDWQWADDASRMALAGLRDLAGASLLVLLTMRPVANETADERLDRFERIELVPLSDDESQVAVRQVLPDADPFLVSDICAAAGGNPLFIEELCHSVAYGERDFRTHDGSGWLDILIESRFARLTDAQAGLLSTAAVIGNVIPLWLLERTTGIGEHDPLLQALADEDFVFPGEREGTLRFKHGITRDVVYDSVGLRERRALHLRIAAALRQHGADEEDLYEALAYHYGAGGDASATAHYAELAGDKAYAAAALDRAQRQYRAALDALDRLPASPEVERRWSSLARRYAQAGIWDPSNAHLPILERAVERAAARGDAFSLALADYWVGYHNYGLGHSARAIAHGERALRAAQPLGHVRLEAQIRATLGQARWQASEHGPALVLLDEAIGMVRADPDRKRESVAAFAYSLACKGWILADLGRFEEARELFEESQREVVDIEHPVHASILSSYVIALLWQGRMEEAAAIAADTQRVTTRVRTFYIYAKTVATEAYARWAMTGDADAALRLLRATEWLEEGGRHQYMSLNYGWLAEVMAAAGRPGPARHFAARALVRARLRDRLGEAVALRAVARVAAAAANETRADHYLARAMAAAEARGSPHEVAATRLCAAEIAHDRGQRNRARGELDLAESAFAAMDMRWHARRAARLRGVLD